MHIQQAIYEKLLNGDTLSTYELQSAANFHRELAHDLRKLGPKFSLAAMESSRVYLLVSDYLCARERTA